MDKLLYQRPMKLHSRIVMSGYDDQRPPRTWEQDLRWSILWNLIEYTIGC